MTSSEISCFFTKKYSALWYFYSFLNLLDNLKYACTVKNWIWFTQCIQVHSLYTSNINILTLLAYW